MRKPDYWMIRLRDECAADEWLVPSSVSRALDAGCKHIVIEVDVDGHIEIKGYRDPIETYA